MSKQSELIRQQYHLEPDKGLLNDPNGLVCFNGKYHIFFQWNRFEKNHSYKEWGLFTSKDLINWQFEGSAIIPDQEYDIDGVYSGSGYVIKDQLYLFYTGNNKKNGKRTSSQCLSVTKDGRKYQKKGIILKTPKDFTEHFRDPKVFGGKKSDYYMVVGAQQQNGKGALALCHSEDGETWNYERKIAVSKQYEMIECPDLFELDGKHVLLFNPQKRDNAADQPVYSFSAYKLEKFNEETKTFEDEDLDQGYQIMDAGFDFYVPQTFLSPDGRRILFAWMSRLEDDQEQALAKTQPRIHCLTLPREVSLKGEKLCQKPVKELYHLLGKDIKADKKDGKYLAEAETRTFFMNLKQLENDEDFHISLYHGDVEITYKAKDKKITFARKNWVNGMMQEKTASIDDCHELEIWSDHSSIEVFVNEGQTVFSARIFPNSQMSEIMIEHLTDDMKIELREIQSRKEKEE